MEPFLREYARMGTILHAAEAVGITRWTVDDWRKKYPEFEDKFRHAKDDITQKLEDTAISKAMAGDDTLLIFLLKGLRPDIYTERRHVRIESEQTLKVVFHVTAALKQQIPDHCPGCGTLLSFKETLAKHLIQLSEKLNTDSVKQHRSYDAETADA
jgi:hypothetical protein